MKKNKVLHRALHALDEQHAQSSFKIEANSVNDKGAGLVMFGRAGLVITDDSEMWSGAKYDIPSLDITGYGGKLTADHSRSIQSIIGKVIGTRKLKSRVVIDGIQFAIEENALALYAYNMLKAGYLTDFSIETVGPWPEDDGVYRNASLVGLSAVVVGNNKSAKINEIAINSVAEAKQMGLDASIVETNFVCYDNTEEDTQTQNNKNNEENMKYILIKNSRGFALQVTYQDEAKAWVTVTVPAGQSVQVLAEQSAAVEKQINEATEPKVETEAKDTADNAALMAELKKVQENQEKIEKQLFDNGAQEPGFNKDKGSKGGSNANNELKSLDADARHQLQITNAWNFLKNGNQEAGNILRSINEINLEALKEAGKVKNSITIADFGSFVISPELLTEIEGHRSNFQPLLSRLNFRETMSQQMAWLKRNGDINMTEVEFCDDDADGNLKPISEYSADINQSNLMELAAVTPICNAATRFLAVDLLSDAAEGFRTDFDRKKAQLFIARLQQAVNSSGNTTVLNTVSGDALNPLFSIIDTAGEVAENVDSGVWIFSTATYYQLLKFRISAGAGTDSGLDLFTTGENGQFVGSPYIVVPNELMPKLNSATTRTFTVGGVSVTINQGMFFVDLATFTGRTSGGLQYDLSTEASYEVTTGETTVVKSAFQRNELLLRGSFFRGGAVRDEDKVAGVGAPGVS